MQNLVKGVGKGLVTYFYNFGTPSISRERLELGHRPRIRILRIFSLLKFNEFYEFFSVEKICKKLTILQIIDV